MGSILPCCLPCGKAGEFQILCCQGFEVNDYNFTLDALALKPSGFCNVRVRVSSGGQKKVVAQASRIEVIHVSDSIINYKEVNVS
jgi:hypothetical protein